MRGSIRTIDTDLDPTEAGPVYAHEHLIIDSPLVAADMAHIHLPSVDEAVAETELCLAAGVRTMVDAMPAASGRHPERLAELAAVTGLNIIATTGLHTAKYYESVAWTREESPNVLADRFVADIEEGIDLYDYLGDRVERTAIRAGLIKVAALTEELTASDRRLFEAAALTQTATGAPILTHTEGGLGGLQQIEQLLAQGVAPDRIALSHTDKIDDVGYHREMLSTGVYLCYDQGLRTPERSAHLVRAMVDAGFGRQLVFGTDGARRSLWSTLGGSPGLDWLFRGFVELLRTMGLAEEVDEFFTANPARFLTFD